MIELKIVSLVLFIILFSTLIGLLLNWKSLKIHFVWKLLLFAGFLGVLWFLFILIVWGYNS